MEEKYMKLAIKEANKALNIGEMPVGAVVVKNNKVIGKGYNKKEKNKNSIMHAEIIAIQKACKKNNDWRLSDCEIYVTMEPCNMCMGAIIESRIKKIYCGVRNNNSCEINDILLTKYNMKLEYNILNEEIYIQIKEFFKKLRSTKRTNV